MVKVFIDMDQGFRWWPVLETDPIHELWKRDMTMEIPEELLREYNIAYTLYSVVQDKLEALYRIQNGYTQHPTQVIPEHTMLKEKNDE